MFCTDFGDVSWLAIITTLYIRRYRYYEQNPRSVKSTQTQLGKMLFVKIPRQEKNQREDRAKSHTGKTEGPSLVPLRLLFARRSTIKSREDRRGTPRRSTIKPKSEYQISGIDPNAMTITRMLLPAKLLVKRGLRHARKRLISHVSVDNICCL